MKTLLKIFCKFVILIHFYFLPCMASVRGTLEFDGKSGMITNGDIVDSQLSLWPWERNQDTNFLKRYTGKTFLAYFHVIDVTNVQVADNMLTAKFRIVIKKTFTNQDKAMLEYGGDEIPIEIIAPRFTINEKIAEKFILFRQFEPKDQTLYYIIITLLTVMGLAVFWLGFNYYKKRKQEKKTAEERERERKELVFLMKNVGNKERYSKIISQKRRDERDFDEFPQVQASFNNDRQASI